MRPLALAFFLLVATFASATDYYVPAGGDGSRLELQIANPSPARAVVTLEVLGLKPVEITLEGGQSVRWNDAASGESALRVSADIAVKVTAVSHCDACGSSVSVPVLDVSDAVDEGDVPMRGQLHWRSALLVVNPGDGIALVTLAVHRGDELVEQSLLRIPARGARQVRLDRGADHRLTFRSARPLLVFGEDRNERTGARVFTSIAPQATGGKRRSVRSATPPAPPPPEPQTMSLTPSKDTTLYQSSSGTISNGAGIHLFAGATGARSLRRALLAFDVASQIPPGSRITRATLALNVSLTIAGPQPLSLHRVTADWGQGSSNAGVSRDGNGATARTGDATWVHRFVPDQRWTAQGGDFSPTADATTTDQGSVRWESSDAMIARVQGWLDQPSANFGWIVIGNEATSTTAKRFDSREIGSEATRPTLTVEFVR